MVMKYANKFSLNLCKNNQQCANNKEVVQKFTQISTSSVPQAYKVYHQASQREKCIFQVKLL